MTSNFGRGAMRTLAALLLVDGRSLETVEIARIASPLIGEPRTVSSRWIPLLRRMGCRIETAGMHGEGYRLLEIPPDELLDDVLVVVHRLREEQPTRLWGLFGRPTATSQSPAAPSPVSSARRSA